MQAPLCILAIDQRDWLAEALYGAGAELTREQIAHLHDVKLAVAEGGASAKAAGVPGQPGLLVDERFGAEAARHALSTGLLLAMPIELDRQAVLTPEYGDDWLTHLESFEPVLPKLLIWHNVEAHRATLDAQLQSLIDIAAQLRATGRKLMLEILAPPTRDQLARVGGNRARYDRELLPSLTMGAIDEVNATGVRVDVWKLEGMPDVQTFADVRARCTKGNPETQCLVLGRNERPERVDAWLRDAAAGGFDGFAIGRSVWWRPISAWREGQTDRATAVRQVCSNYTHVCEVFATAHREATGP